MRDRALLSLRPQHADSFIAGNKTVEIRRGKLNLPRSTELWFYSTHPRAEIELVGWVDKVAIGTAAAIWQQFGRSAAVPRSLYDTYTAGSSRVSAIILSRVVVLEPALTLDDVRAVWSAFQPPQRMAWIGPEHRLDDIFSKAKPNGDLIG